MSDSKLSKSEPQPSLRARISSLFSNQSVVLIVTLVILGAFFQWGSEGVFLELGLVGTVLTDWGSLILLAVGQTFVIITGGIDLSVGTTVSLASVVAGWFMINVFKVGPEVSGTDANPYILIVVLLCLVTGLIVGAINAWLINVLKLSLIHISEPTRRS